MTATRRVAPAAAAALLLAIATAVAASSGAKQLDEGQKDFLKNALVQALKKGGGPAGEILSNVHELVIDPVFEVINDTPERGKPADRVDRWLLALTQAGVTAAWPPYGFIVAGGKISIGGVTYGMESLIAAAHDGQNLAVLVGPEHWWQRFNNVMADQPFIQMPALKSQGITLENFGEKVTSEEQLRKLWFELYYGQLKDFHGKAEAERVTQENWQRLRDIWRIKRASVILPRFVETVDAEMVKALRESEMVAAKDPGFAPGGGQPGSVADGERWSGTWANTNGLETATISGSGGTVSANFTYAGSDFKGSGSWSRCESQGAVTIKCAWTGQHDDSTKSGQRSGVLTVSISGDSISGTLVEAEPKWSYKPGFGKHNVTSSMFAGKNWPMSYTRK